MPRRLTSGGPGIAPRACRRTSRVRSGCRTVPTTRVQSSRIDLLRLRRAVADWRLKRQRGIPGEEDPGVLRYLGDVGVDQRPALRLGIDRGEMRIGEQLAHQLAGLAGIDEVVDDQKPLAGAAAELGGLLRNTLEHF